MGDVDRSDAEPLLQRAKLVARLVAKPRVQIGQRLVEQKDARLEDQGPGDSDPLLLAARERGSRTIGEGVHFHEAQCPMNPVAHLGCRSTPDTQGIGYVLEDRHVRPDRVGLEHHAEIAPFRRHEDATLRVADYVSSDQDTSAGVLLESRDHAQRRCLAAT